MMRRSELAKFLTKGFTWLGSPSFFDCLVMLFIVGLPVVFKVAQKSPLNCMMVTSLYLVFGSLTLWIVSLVMYERRTFRSLPLMLLTLYTTVNVFLKSWRDPGIAEWYINWSMLNEGFIYVLAAAMLITTIVKYARNYVWYYVSLIVVIVGWFIEFVIPNRSNSPLMAMVVAVPIIALKLRRKALAAILLAFLGLILYIRWDWLMYKFYTRPMMWKPVIKNMLPFGEGFPHDIPSIIGWIWPGNYAPGKTIGWCFINNDYLEFTKTHGAVGLFLVGWFLVSILRRAKVSLAYYLCLSAAILCMFQRTIYFPIQAGIILVIISLTILENGTDTSLPNKKESLK